MKLTTATMPAKAKAKAKAKYTALASLLLIIMVMLIMPIATVSATPGDPNTWWSSPQRLLPYAGGGVQLATDPIDSSVSYITEAGGYGVVSGKETSNWLNGDFKKLGTDTPVTDQFPTHVYDEHGTMFAVWGGRNAQTADFNVLYNSVQRGTNNVGIGRNLTQELFGRARHSQGEAHIAYSKEQHKIFIIFVERTNPDGDGDLLLYFVESGNQGSTWSQPLELGTLSGYAPALPNLIVDTAGLPHVFYGVMAQNDSRSWLFERVRAANGNWSAAQDISGADRARIFRPKFTLAPNGDIWSVWGSDPPSGVAVDKQVTVAHWNASSGQWQHFNNINQSVGGDGFDAIAVGSDGVIWTIWTDIAGPVEDWTVKFSYSTDNGQTWHAPLQVLRNSDFMLKRSFDIAAIASKKYIYLALTAESADPNFPTGATIFLQTIPETSRLQAGGPAPTSTPNNTAQPTFIAATPTPTNRATTAAAQTTSAAPAVNNNSGTSTTGQAGFQVAPTISKPQAQPAQSQATSPTPPPLGPTPTPTLAPAIAQATSYAQTQLAAAQTPQVMQLPTEAAGPFVGGVGPKVVLPTATAAAPKPTMLPPTVTATTIPTTTEAVTTTTAAIEYQQATLAATPAVTQTAGATQSAATATITPSQPKSPPPTGALWLLPVGIVAAAKGALNLITARAAATVISGKK